MFRSSLLIASLLPFTAFANAAGAIGYSGAPGTGSCNDCHSGGSAPTVTITGPDTLAAGATGTYSCTVNGGTRVGVNIAITEMLAALNPVSSNLGIAFRELYQVSPQNSGTSFQFSLSAPPIAGPMTIYCRGNAVNGNGATSGDLAAGTSKVVTIMAAAGSPGDPVISTAAAAMQSPLRAKSTTVSVVAADDGGGANLTYIWSSTGPGAVVFSPNSSNSAATSTATFSRAGDYMITVTVRDGANHTKTSTFALTVEANFTALKMTPYAVHLNGGQTQTFNAVAVDQFDAPVTGLNITYEVPAGGGVFGTNCISACTSNVFKAQSGSGGPFTIVSRASGIATSSTVAIGTTMLPGSTDTTPPTVALVAPDNGLPLTDGEVFEAIASDPMGGSGVAKVEFQIAQIPVATAMSSPWRVSYAPVSGLPGGRQPLTAVATDLAGNQAISSSVIVDVPNTGTGGGSGGGSGACGPTTCPMGCCDSTGACLVTASQNNAKCGNGGSVCAACRSDETCGPNGNTGSTCQATVPACACASLDPGVAALALLGVLALRRRRAMRQP